MRRDDYTPSWLVVDNDRPTDNSGIAGCENSQCMAHESCLRYQLKRRYPEKLCGDFAPSNTSQKCRYFRTIK